MVSANWPGQPVPTPIPDGGLTFSWNNAFVKDMPYLQAYPYYDPNRPVQTLGAQGAQRVQFQITGEGKSVDFVCSSGFQGNVMILWPATPTTPNQTYGAYWYGIEYAGGAYARTDPLYFKPTSAIRMFLTKGESYVLEIGSSSYDSAGGTGFDQDFTLDVSYTPDNLNDVRDKAFDVVIQSDGMTYQSAPVLNTNFTAFGTGTDDPTGNNVYLTAWWKYEASKDTDLTVSFSVLPQPVNWFRLNVYRQVLEGTGSLQLLAHSESSAAFTVPGVLSGDLIYFQIGSFDYWNHYQSAAQKYQLQVTGAKSAGQPPPSGGTIVGTGTGIKRVWMYTPDRRWIAMPQGSGEDAVVRSLNVWDGKKWMTPIWHQGASWLAQQNNDRSLELFAPGRSWASTPVYNNNYANNTAGSAYKPTHPDWIRLTHLTARPDPTWRIADLNRSLPLIPPNQRPEGVDAQGLPVLGTPVRYRGGTHAKHFSQINGTVNAPDERFDVARGSYGIPGLDFAGDLLTAVSHIADSNIGAPDYHGITTSDLNYTTILDMAMIRQRIQDLYRTRNLDMTGQLNPIEVQIEKRVYLTCSINWYVIFSGPSVGANNFQGMQMRFWAKRNVPTLPIDNTGNRLMLLYPVNLRYAPDLTPQGAVVHTKDFPVVSTTTPYTNPFTNTTWYTTGYNMIENDVVFEIKNPGHDNIAFYTDIAGMPSLGGGLGYYRIDAQLTAKQIEVHYCDTGHDTPAYTHKTATVSF